VQQAPEGRQLQIRQQVVERQQAQAVQVQAVQAPVQAQVQPVQVQIQPAQIQIQPVQIQGQPIQVQVQVGPGVQLLPANGPGGFPVAPGVGRPGTITLVDGKAKALPADVSGAVRVRVSERADVLGPAAPDEILVALQVTPEPKVRWQHLAGVRVTRAVDDRGQVLAESTAVLDPNFNPANPNVQPGVRGVVVGRAVRLNPVGLDNQQLVAVRLKQGTQPAKSLAELRGVVTAQVLTEAQAVLTVDDVLNASGKTFKGGEGGVIRVAEVKKTADGQVEVRFDFEAPRDCVLTDPAVPGNPGVEPGVLPVPAPQGAINRRGGVRLPRAQPVAEVADLAVPVVPEVGALAPGLVAAPVDAGGFLLLDEKGNRLPLTGQNRVVRPNPQGGAVVEQRLTFRAQKSEPARLVLMGHRSVTLEIPFTLKDVTLP